MAGISLAVILFWPRVSRRIPGAILAILLSAILVRALQLPVETVGSRFGDLGGALPRPALPTVSVENTLLLVGPAFSSLIPLPALSAILVVVAYHMSEWRTFRAELRAPKGDVAVLLAVFALTVLVDLTVAIQVGMVLASFLFMQRMALSSLARPRPSRTR